MHDSERGIRVHLGIAHRFYSLDGAKIDELNINIRNRHGVDARSCSLTYSIRFMNCITSRFTWSDTNHHTPSSGSQNSCRPDA